MKEVGKRHDMGVQPYHPKKRRSWSHARECGGSWRVTPVSPVGAVEGGVRDKRASNRTRWTAT